MLRRRKDLAVVAEASDGLQAIREFQRHRPDVTLMDLRMPGANGGDAIIAIRQKFPDARIIVLSTFAGDEDIYRAFQAGAKAYLLKDVPFEQLLDCIRTVHQGKTWMSPMAAAKLANRVAATGLTTRETQVLQLLVAGKSNKEIGAQLNIAEGTVKVHISSILKKLGVSGRTEAIAAALARGIVHLPETFYCL